MNVSELRQRAGAALARAREIETRIASADEPTAEDRASLDTAIQEASGLFDQVNEHEARAARFAELEARAIAPGPRVGAPLMPHTDASNTRNGKHSYSLIRAIQGELAQREGLGSFVGIERETHDALANQRGKAPAGLLIPWDVECNYRGLRPDQIQYRDLTTTTGAGAVPNIVRPTMVDVLRAKMVLVGMGATVISDMTQPFSLPKTTAAQSGSWVSTEGTPAAAGNPTVGQIPFSYKMVEAKTKLSRQFIMGASVDAERYVVDQLTKAVATTVESGALTGSGTSGQPKGLFSYTSGPSILALGTNGAKPTWANLLTMTGAVDTANAPSDNRAWLFNPTLVSYLQATPKIGTTYPTFILGDQPNVAGYGYASTSLVPNNLTKGTSTGVCSAMAFGSWSELAIALFSGLDLFIDPYSAQPHVNITIAQDVDVNFLHTESFSICVDALTA